jgi:hypothetical protein
MTDSVVSSPSAACKGTGESIYCIYTKQGPMMTVSNDSLLLKFRSRDTKSGVTRNTIKALAEELDMNETQVIHVALSKFAAEFLPAYAPDDGPLTAKQIKALRLDAEKHMPVGKTLSKEVLFQ